MSGIDTAHTDRRFDEMARRCEKIERRLDAALKTSMSLAQYKLDARREIDALRSLLTDAETREQMQEAHANDLQARLDALATREPTDRDLDLMWEAMGISLYSKEDLRDGWFAVRDCLLAEPETVKEHGEKVSPPDMSTRHLPVVPDPIVFSSPPKCPNCDGRGHYYASGAICAQCNGTGHTSKAPSVAPYPKWCQRCSGGRVITWPDGTTMPCDVCGGKP